MASTGGTWKGSKFFDASTKTAKKARSAEVSRGEALSVKKKSEEDALNKAIAKEKTGKKPSGMSDREYATVKSAQSNRFAMAAANKADKALRQLGSYTLKLKTTKKGELDNAAASTLLNRVAKSYGGKVQRSADYIKVYLPASMKKSIKKTEQWAGKNTKLSDLVKKKKPFTEPTKAEAMKWKKEYTKTATDMTRVKGAASFGRKEKKGDRKRLNRMFKSIGEAPISNQGRILRIF